MLSERTPFFIQLSTALQDVFEGRTSNNVIMQWFRRMDTSIRSSYAATKKKAILNALLGVMDIDEKEQTWLLIQGESWYTRDARVHACFDSGAQTTPSPDGPAFVRA